MTGSGNHQAGDHIQVFGGGVSREGKEALNPSPYAAPASLPCAVPKFYPLQ